MIQKNLKISRTNTSENRLSLIKYLNYILSALFLLFTILTIYPLINSVFYTFYQGDDFSHANNVGIYNGNFIELIEAGLKYAKETYMNWQGTFLGMFLQAALSPLNGAGYVQLRFVMEINLFLFIFSLLYTIYSLCKKYNIPSCFAFLLHFLLIFSFVGLYSWPEIFYWFSGAVAYSYPLSIGIISIGVYLSSDSPKKYILSCLLAFLASGGTLAFAGTLCYWILVILFIHIIKRNTTKWDISYFLSALSGAIINTIAPGNYKRYSVIDSSGFHMIQAISNLVTELEHSLKQIFVYSPFIIIITICFLIGLLLEIKIIFNKKVALLSTIIMLPVPIITCFPVCLAFTGLNNYFPNRCQFIEFLAIMISSIYSAFVLGILIGGFIKTKFIKYLISFITLALTLSLNYNSIPTKDNFTIYQLYQECKSGSYKEYYYKVNEIYYFIENCEEIDVKIYGELPTQPTFFPSLHIGDDLKGDWVNESIAHYYHKNSLVHIPSDK